MREAGGRRLLVVTPYYPPRRGGMENYAAAVSRGLAGLGWQVTVVTSRGRGEPEAGDPSREGGVTVRRLTRWGKVSNTPVSPAWPLTLRQIIGELRPHLIDAHTPVPVLGELAVRLAGDIPTVVHYHNDVVKEDAAARLLWWLCLKSLVEPTLRRATRIVATSPLYAARSPTLRPHLGKVEIIPPGVDIRRFHPGVSTTGLEGKYAGREVLLFVGQMDRTHDHKGVGDLLRAIALLRATRPRLLCLVAGAGDGIAAHRREAERMGIGAMVEFPGEVSEEELPGYYRLARALVLPSVNDSEGFGMVLLEAAACGTPAVATRVGGIPFAVEEGRTGLLVPPRDSAALAAALGRLLKEDGLRSSLGENARRRAVEGFSWERQVDRHHRLFSGLCGG